MGPTPERARAVAPAALVVAAVVVVTSADLPLSPWTNLGAAASWLVGLLALGWRFGHPALPAFAGGLLVAVLVALALEPSVAPEQSDAGDFGAAFGLYVLPFNLLVIWTGRELGGWWRRRGGPGSPRQLVSALLLQLVLPAAGAVAVVALAVGDTSLPVWAFFALLAIPAVTAGVVALARGARWSAPVHLFAAFAVTVVVVVGMAAAASSTPEPGGCPGGKVYC